jgi:hypothetical protein
VNDDRQLDALLRTFYEDVSGPAGAPRNRHADAVFHPHARLMRTGVDEAGRPWIKVMTPAEYAVDTVGFFAANDFHEIEVARRVERFGNVAWVRSVYEARRHPDDATVIKRGVNSIQLFHDGERWWVVSVLWDNERAGLSLPAEWLAG